jgi:hypothetical protein
VELREVGTCDHLPDLIRLVEAEDVLDVILGTSIGDVLSPALSAPLLVGVEEGNVFEALDGCAVDDGFPVVHPGDLGCLTSKSMCERRSLLVVEHFRESNATLARGGTADGRCFHQASESREGEKEGCLNHDDGDE